MIQSMKIFRHTLAFCSLMVVPFMASATPSLPQPQDVKTAIERALDSIELVEPTSGNREERNQFLIQDYPSNRYALRMC